MIAHTRAATILTSASFVCLIAFASAVGAQTPRIESVVPAREQPHETNEAVIWYDDFNHGPKRYAESQGAIDTTNGFGGVGGAMRCLYEKGKRGVGNRKVVFGDSPVYANKASRAGQRFDEIYWRIYVKHQVGWTGAPAKMSRATSFASSKWSQAMIAHVWSGGGDSLTLDPVRGVDGERVLTTKYNDFPNMKWLGNKPVSRFPIHATEESGAWVLVECRAKLNTPGKSDGVNQLWIDGRLECERRNLNFRGNYTEHGINAVFLEAYWNDGSPVTQSRWYDNFVISTKPIGPVVCPRNPVLIKAPVGNASDGWEAEIAADYEGCDIVYQSRPITDGDRLTVNTQNGKFTGSVINADRLAPGQTYYTRVRHQAPESNWSRWHQGFRVSGRR